MAALLYISNSSAQGFNFLYILANHLLFSVFLIIASNECEVVSHCGFDLISLMIRDVKHLFMSLLVIWPYTFKDLGGCEVSNED